MLSEQLIEFYENWTEKSNQIVGDKLSDVYDNYITLFIMFNNLYNQIPKELARKGDKLPPKIYDNIAATDYVVSFLDAKNIMTEFVENGNCEDISSIIRVIDQEIFYIKFKYGESQRDEDLKILENLKSVNHVNKATAILQVVYHVRCNMFHGHKDFKEYQRMLIKPLINIIKTINKKLFLELNK